MRIKGRCLSNNSICLRLYKKENNCGSGDYDEPEDDAIGFKIKENELFRIAKKVLG